MGTMTTSNEDDRRLEKLARSVQLRPRRYHEALAQARAVREAIRQEYGVLPDSAEDIRAMRDEALSRLTSRNGGRDSASEERDTELAGLDTCDAPGRCVAREHVRTEV
jgi:hypothetical protein